MPAEPAPSTSFSRLRRWGIISSVLVSILAVLALVVMINYLGSRYFHRFSLSAEARMRLSPQTLGLLRSLTNQVHVIIYYDKKDPLYSSVSALLEEYRLASPNLTVETVDYKRDPGAAQKVKSTHKDLLNTPEDRDLVIFESNLRTNTVPGKLLGDYALEQLHGDSGTGEREFRQKLKSFRGEMFFSATLLGVTTAKPFKAYFLAGHAEHDPRGQNEMGYAQFTSVLVQNNIEPALLQLLGANGVPADCNLLIIAGPQKKLQPTELDKIRRYLEQGGKLLVAFNSAMKSTNTGLEAILEEWGVDVGLNQLRDPKNSTVSGGINLFVDHYNKTHPAVNSVLGSRLELIQPRSIGQVTGLKEAPNAPKVDELAFTSETAYVDNSPLPAGKMLPLMVAVEKPVAKERGVTRMVVLGDSLLFDNQLIDLDSNSNRDFANSVVNWLLDRTALMQGIAAHTVTEYRLNMTRAELQHVQWLFLAGMPGGILVLGGLVWLRRRH